MCEINISDNLVISDKNNKKIRIKTPVVYLPFGLEKEYENYYLKLQLRKSHDEKFNKKLKNFYEKIEYIENQIEEKTGKKIKSQIRLHEKYDPIIITKIPFYFGKPKVDIKDKNGIPVNIFKIEKGVHLECEIEIDRLFLYKGDITYKIKNTKINLI